MHKCIKVLVNTLGQNQNDLDKLEHTSKSNRMTLDIDYTANTIPCTYVEDKNA